jgi:pSer/pThr/pTyr-binding forkhead associated (FHA) protein
MVIKPDISAVRDRPTVPPTGPWLRLSCAGRSRLAQCETLEPVTLIGSRRDCHLSLNDPDVSKVHSAVVHTGTTLLVVDLCSRAGTFLNGQSVRVRELRPGDRLQIGTVVVNVDTTSRTPVAVMGTLTPPPPALTLGGRGVDLKAGAAIIGRRGTCDLVLDTPDVSLAHTLLFSFAGRPAVFDLGSRSGTFLNGKRIALAHLNQGDRLMIGGERLSVELGEKVSARLAETAPAGEVEAEPERPAMSVAAAPVSPPAPPELPPPQARVPAAPPRPQPPGVSSADGSGGRRVATGGPTDAPGSVPVAPRGGTDELVEALLADLLSARGKVEQQVAELSQREAALVARSTQLEQYHNELVARATQIETHNTELAARAADLHTRADELEASAGELEARTAQVAQAKAELDRRAADLDQQMTVAREKLAAAASHEQAVAAAWEELERWHAAREARFKVLFEQATRDLRAPSPDDLPKTAALARLFESGRTHPGATDA